MVEAESISRITQFSDFQTFEFHEPVKMANMFAKLILIKKGSQDLSGGPVADSVLPKQRACLGSVCGQGTRPHTPQLRVYMPQ